MTGRVSCVRVFVCREGLLQRKMKKVGLATYAVGPRPGKARQGYARQGKVRQGKAWRGMAWQ